MFYGGIVHGQWYSMGRLGIGDYRENTRRQLLLGNEVAGVASSSRGRYGIAYGESGYRLGWSRNSLTPYISLQYAQIQRDGFDELGADGFGLKSAAQTVARWQAGLGTRADHRWMLLGGGSLDLQARLLWQQSFGVRGDAFQASFSAINQFAPVNGVGLARQNGVVGTSLSWAMSKKASLQLGYDFYFGERQQARIGSMNLSWAF
jgi:outer membrane autotransporter protein